MLPEIDISNIYISLERWVSNVPPTPAVPYCSVENTGESSQLTGTVSPYYEQLASRSYRESPYSLNHQL